MITGSRRGEVSALRWRHVDFDRAIIWVHRSNAQTRSGVREKETKTGQRRKVALDPETLALLTQHRRLWEQRCASLGCTVDDEAFMFSPAPDGSAPYAPQSLTQRYRRMATKLKLRSTRLHSLRHYSATELVAAGVDLRTVAGRLGHGSGGATTLKVYAAWVDEADRRAATTIAGVMPKPVPVQVPRGPYEQIAEAIREDIRTGRLKPGDQLPTIAELAAANTVAVGTAHRATALLKDEGLIVVTRGRRAVVSTRISHENHLRDANTEPVPLSP